MCNDVFYWIYAELRQFSTCFDWCEALFLEQFTTSQRRRQWMDLWTLFCCCTAFVGMCCFCICSCNRCGIFNFAQSAKIIPHFISHFTRCWIRTFAICVLYQSASCGFLRCSTTVLRLSDRSDDLPVYSYKPVQQFIAASRGFSATARLTCFTLSLVSTVHFRTLLSLIIGYLIPDEYWSLIFSKMTINC